VSNKKKIQSSMSPEEIDRQRAKALHGNFVVSLERCLTDEQIEELKALVDQHGQAAAVYALGATGTSLSESTRRSRTCFLPPEQYKWAYDIAWKVAKKVNETYQFEIKPINEVIQIAAYDESELGYYNWHTDAGIFNMRRKISISIPLSSPAEYTGGEFQIMTSKEPVAILQNKGCPIVFPGILWHRVTPVTKGRRYSFVCWVGGPAWR